MTQPNYNSEGQQVWNPSTGQYFTPGKEDRESYAGIVAALQDQMASSGSDVKSYPPNFAGIIAAIQDLTLGVVNPAGSQIGPQPDNGDIVIDANGDPVFDYSTPPVDGELWFDTRQGRLFIAFEEQWYQTNGGDGLSIITETATPPSASNLAIGQTWFDRSNSVLYLFAGTYTEVGGAIVTVPTATTTPIWIQLVDTTAFQTTATLPLAGPSINAKIIDAVTNSNYLPFVDPALVTHQDDANLYFIDALDALDAQIKVNSISLSTNPPTNPVAGELWFDTEDIELSIWYIEPGQAYGQWVPTFSASMQDEDIANLKTLVTLESSSRLSAFNQLTDSVNTLSQSVTANNVAATASINSLQSQVSAIDSPDLTPYITTSQEQLHVTDLQNQINTTKADIASLTSTKASVASLLSKESALQADINTRATISALSSVSASIPSITGLATEAYVTSLIAAAPGLASTGDTLTGAIVVDKTDVGIPTFDYSTNDWDGRLSHKYMTNCDHTTDHYTTFGTNSNFFEYAWTFDSNEDFAWVHSANGKVVSIDKTGLAATNLYLATFGTNTTNGRVLTSTIDVGARLATYQTALTNLRTNAASATTVDELKTAIANALANV